MIRSVTRVVCLMFLLVVIAASQTVLFAETESKPLTESSSPADTNNNAEVDDSNALLLTILLADTNAIRVFQNLARQNSAKKILSKFSAIRAPPHIYL